MTVGAASDSGKIRQRNEDSYMVLYDQPGLPNVFVIADGMGGHSSGETASKLAVDHVSEYVMANPEAFMRETEIRDSLIVMMRNTNRLIMECSETSDAWRGMGTTLTVAVIIDAHLYIGHVGDSRIYLLDTDGMRKITRDHSYIEELVQSGEISMEQARNHPDRNVITRAIGGGDEDMMADTYTSRLTEGCHVLLCTDGLTNEVDETVIQQIIREAASPQDACENLIRAANDHGGRDNITVIILRC